MFPLAARSQLANIQFTTTTNNGQITITGFSATGSGPLVIPSTINGLPVTSIADEAFFQCTGLTSVTIPNGVTNVGAWSFYQCTGLTSVTIPASVANIGINAFYVCITLNSITVAAQNPAFSSINGVLFNKTQTTLIQYPAGAVSSSYAIPNGVSDIEDEAFAYCGNLTSVTMPDSVTSFGNPPFDSCTKLTSIAVSTQNPAFSSINGVLFNKTQTTLIQYPAGAASSSYAIPDGVSTIAGSAFALCANLTRVTIPDGVTNIGYLTFRYCTSLTNVTIPSSVTSIANLAFFSCTSLTSAVFKGNPPNMGTTVFGSAASGFTAYYYNGATGFTSPTWNDGGGDSYAAIDLGNPSAPIITSVNPNPVPAVDGTQTFTIIGSNFTTGCTVTLRDLGAGQTFTSRPFTLMSSTQLVLNSNFTTFPSTWSVEVINSFGASSGQYRFQVGTGATPTLAVASVGGTTFTPVRVGSTSNLTFTLTNKGTTAINGTASVMGPFTIEGTATYTLQPGQSLPFTVQFTPIGTGAQSGYLSFTGGTGLTIPLYGSGTANTALGTFSGRVVDINGAPIPGALITASSGGVATMDSDGIYTLSVQPGSCTLTATVPGQNFQQTVIPTITVVAGQSPSAPDIQLLPMPLTNAATQNIPVVFVRGFALGSQPAFGNDPYWNNLYAVLKGNASPPYANTSSPFTNLWDPNATTTINGQTVNYSGPGIDGTKSVSDNVQPLINYIGEEVQQYFKINGTYPSINIVAHSMGGLIVRQALDNHNYIFCTVTNKDGSKSGIHIKVNTVIMLGTPNAGTVWADAVILANSVPLESNKFFAGTISQAAMSQMTTTFVRNYFNQNFSWPSSVPVFVMAGTGGSNGFPLEDPTFGIALQALGSILGKSSLTPEGVNDGVVTRPSVEGEYDSLPLDPLNLGLQASVYLGPNNVTDIEALNQSLDHITLYSTPAPIAWITNILLSGQLPALVQPGLNVANKNFVNISLPKTSTATLALPTEQLDNRSGTLSQGSIVTLNVACDANATFTVNLLADPGGVNFTLKDPSGNSINSTSPQNNSNVVYLQNVDPVSGIVCTTYTITSPTQGIWTVTLDGTGLTRSSVDYQLSASGDSSVTLQSATAPFFHNSHEAVVSCSLQNMGTTPPTPVQATSVTAQIVYPDGTVNAQTLFDDGFHNDGAANDGTYAAILPNLTEPGQYFVTYRATGNYSENSPYTRYATGSFMVSSEDASISGSFTNQPVPSSGPAVQASMLVNCLVNANAPGTYRLTGQLIDSTRTLVIPASVEMDNLKMGTTTAALNFDLTQFLQVGFTGTATLINVQLFEQTANGLQWLDAYPGSFSIQIGPQITSQPQSKSVAIGSSTQLSVSTIGDATVTYQWLFNGSPINGQTTATLSLSNLTIAQAGNYSVVVTDETGTVTSLSAALNVRPPTAFSDWATANATSNDPTATPQNDGISNLLKYLYDISPTQPMSSSERAALPTLGSDTTTAPGTEYLTLTYRENPFITGLTAHIQTSSDLKTWTTLTPSDVPPDFLSQQVGTDTNTGDPIMEVGVKVTGEKKQFIRLNVTP